MFEYVLDLKDKHSWLTSNYYIGLMFRDYDWTFHPSNLFLSICLWKCLNISILNEKQTLKLARNYYLSLVFETMTESFTQVVFFFWFKYEIVTCLHFFRERRSVYDLQAITTWVCHTPILFGRFKFILYISIYQVLHF